MDSIVTDLTKFLKQNNNFLIKEANIYLYLFNLMAQLLSLAIMQLDDELVEKQKAEDFEVVENLKKIDIIQRGKSISFFCIFTINMDLDKKSMFLICAIK